MKPVGMLCFCLLIAGLAGCKKRGEAADQEIREAGYALTQEGWLEAIRADHLAVVRKMSKSGFDMKEKDQAGRQSLHVAAEAGSRNVAGYFLDSGMPINEADNAGNTPLMLAVLSGKWEMVRWLLQQGADPKIKNKEGYMPLMSAITHHQTKAIEQLAPYHRDDMDSALLLASLVGEASAIDVLTNYGASVHARMEDGRTPLMLAAQNGHGDAVAILMDLGASRQARTESGETAQSFAIAAGHQDIAAMIERGNADQVVGLDSDGQIAAAFAKEWVKSDGDQNGHSKPEVALLEGAKVSTFFTGRSGKSGAEDSSLKMREYSQRELPVEVKKVSGETAILRMSGSPAREITVKPGEAVPNSNLVIVKVFTRTEVGKLNNSQPIHIGVVEVQDKTTNQRGQWRTGSPVVGHEPVALVEDAGSGRLYLAKSGQKFTSEDGRKFVVSDVRPGQLVIEDVTKGEVVTLILRGPKG